MPSIRVTFTYEDAEALLVGIVPGDYDHNTRRLHARAKISAALLARPDYVAPRERRPRLAFPPSGPTDNYGQD